MGPDKQLWRIGTVSQLQGQPAGIFNRACYNILPAK